MQKVANRTCIRRISARTLKAAKTRNIIAVFAIALTTMLFTSVFTIGMSLNQSFQQYNFRQVGGDVHGTFKDVTPEQIEKLSSDPLIREWGERISLGMPSETPFNKSHVEVNWLDEACAKHMFCSPETGRLPKEGTMEAATDTRVLKLLGVEPEIGAKFTITYELGMGTSHPQKVTETFTLCGWWEYDSANVASMVLVPNSYADKILKDYTPVDSADMTGQKSMDVMFTDSLHIEKDMKTVLSNQGYQSENPAKDHYIGIGVNWGYTGAQLNDSMDMSTVVGIIVAMLLIVFSGYLIIYNIFRISVTGDIRFYGLLKTIGTTGKQIRKIIQRQTLLLSVIGIPIGLIVGWFVGAVLTPQIMANMSYHRTTMSTSPLIFIGAALLSLITVSFSVRRPAKLAAKVSPVEAVKYTESGKYRKGEKKSEKGARVSRMAAANLRRSKSKTLLVILSLSLAVVLLNITFTFTRGFDMDKYLNQFVCTDFIYGHADYFQSDFGNGDQDVTEEMIQEIHAQGGVTKAGRIYGQTTDVQQVVSRSQLEKEYASYLTGEKLKEYVDYRKIEGGKYYDRLQLYGMEEFPLSKAELLEGSLEELEDTAQNQIVAVAEKDDYGNPIHDSQHYEVGDQVTVRYIDAFSYVDSRTRKTADDTTPEEYMDMKIEKMHEIIYTVCAKVTLPYSIGYRYSGAEQMILPAHEFTSQTGTSTIMSYIFDTESQSTDKMETFLKDYTENVQTNYDYESKQSYEDQFDSFRNMFLLMGSALSGVIGMIGILNFVNAVVTSVITRKREFAVLQAVGMTGGQLKKMLVLEGCSYGISAIVMAFMLNLILSPLISDVLGGMFWFYSYHFVMLPILLMIVPFVFIGVIVPLLAYRNMNRQTIVDRIRESE